MSGAKHSRDGRRRIDPPCEFGHRLQAMECPSCAERTNGETPSAEWWTWYRRRYQKKAKPPVPSGGEGR